ncbi:DMT family transporter [Clostridium sp. BJN0001]|uniref:DMT family transporter n=1 Tax=Clostridium sp. BJN0001 TaxID=2930219 RepID=UPI001FD4B21D|nr:DMT family transporter [Clostridium sp. BJN0001]
MIFSSFGFAMMATFIKLSGDLPSFEKSFYRNFIAILIAGFMLIKNKQSFLGKLENQKLLLLRSTLGTCGIFLNFYAIDRLVLSDANMLNKLSPFFTILLSTIILKEKMTKKQATVVTTSLIFAFLGSLFVIKPKFAFEALPSLSGALGGFCAGAAYTCVRKLSGKEKPNTIVFYFSLFSCLASLPLMMISYKHITLIQFIYLIMAGVFASVGQFGITNAYKFAKANQISIFDYTNIVFSAIISIVLFGVIPDVYSFIGYIIIFLSSFYMFMFNKKMDQCTDTK